MLQLIFWLPSLPWLPKLQLFSRLIPLLLLPWLPVFIGSYGFDNTPEVPLWGNFRSCLAGYGPVGDDKQRSCLAY